MTATGVIARSEPQGLGYQTWEVARHINPARVLLVEPVPARRPTNRCWYDPWPTTSVTWGLDRRSVSGQLDERVVRAWLDGLDVLYTAETLYDWRLSKWAEAAGCAVVCHVNPELLPPVAYNASGVTWWAPTPWLIDRLPAGTRVVPLPVDTDRIPLVADRSGPVRFVHVGGHAAMLDRNGTRMLAEVVRRMRCPAEWLVTGQDGQLPPFLARDRRVRLRKVPAGLPNYWDAYVGDVLVMPRRYGGLSMPAQEAMAAGMCVVMPDCSPNDVWPGPRFPTDHLRTVPMLGGDIPVHEPSPTGLRILLETLARDPAQVDAYQADARRWADDHSWDALLPLWMSELGEAAGVRR